jgi:hypothetical protein
MEGATWLASAWASVPSVARSEIEALCVRRVEARDPSSVRGKEPVNQIRRHAGLLGLTSCKLIRPIPTRAMMAGCFASLGMPS